MDFADFDTRGYRTVDVRTGYAEWVPTYEDTVQDAMDIALLDELRSVEWTGRAADLGCGTGRTAAWLRAHGVEHIDGVDLTPEMLEVARERGAHDTLREGDVADTGLDGGAYDLVVASLVDEHLPSLAPLYAEAWRLARPGGAFVLVCFHPHFIMATGMPTHFTGASGEPLAIATHVHLLSDHVDRRPRGGLDARRAARGRDRRPLDRGQAQVGEVPPPPDLGGLRVAQAVAVFDAHLHVIDPRFPLVANQGYVPDPFTADDYRAATAELNVTGGAVVAGSFQGGSDPSVVVQPATVAVQRGQTPLWLVDALGRFGPGFVGVVELRAGATDEQVLALDAAGVRAVRFNLHRGGALRGAVCDAGWHAEVYAGGARLDCSARGWS